MSHFVGVAFIPRDDDYEVNEDYSKAEQNLDNMFSMGEALQSEYLTELLAPYNEQDDRYCEVSPDLNDRATTLLQAYYSPKRNTEKVNEMCEMFIERERGWAERTTKWSAETKESSSLSLAEISTELEPIMALTKLFRSGTFDLDNEVHLEMFKKSLIDTEDFEINDDYQVFSHYYYNDEGYWDWYEIGGRWDNYFSQDNANNVLEDISLLKGTRMVKKLHNVDWFATVGLKDEDIENRNLDNKVIKSWKKDELGEFILENDKRVVDEYYTTEELLDEEVEIKKYGMMSIITEQYGWEQESQMGMFGTSEKDVMSDDDKAFTESSWDKLVDERIDEMLKDVDDNGVCKWVAVAVDFHI
jgi:hypothetical protein